MKPGYILIVDDDKDAREILSIIVKGMEYSYRTASDGSLALEEIKKESPSLILLDLMMPGMDGFEVLTRLRSDTRTRYIPVIVVTACSQDQINLLRLPGVKDVVQKGKILCLKQLIPQCMEPERNPFMSKQIDPVSPVEESASIIQLN